MSGCRSEAGRLLQILGPATEKLLSPSRVFLLGTVRTLAWAERSWGRRRILDRLQTPEQTVADAVEQRITVMQTAGYERMDYSVLADSSGSDRATGRN